MEVKDLHKVTLGEMFDELDRERQANGMAALVSRYVTTDGDTLLSVFAKGEAAEHLHKVFMSAKAKQEG